MLRIHHVNLHVPPDRLEAEKAFLVDVLGFRPAVPPPELDARVHWFDDDDGVQIHLTVADHQPPLDPGHVAVVLGERHGVVLGRAADGGHRVQGSGAVVNCWDPAGNRWELRQA